MFRLRTGLVCLLAYLLLTQWAAALVPHARMSARLGAAQAEAICDHAGAGTASVDAQGRPLVPDLGADACCPLCHAPPALAADASTVVGRVIAYAPAPMIAPKASRLEGSPRAPPHQPRAPPFA